MYILKNAVTSIVRNKGRNLLIGIIVIVISCATAVTLAIRSSANSLIHSYENQYELSATIEIDRESMHNGMNKELTEEERQEQREKMEDIFSEASDISLDDIKNYGDSKLVKEYYSCLKDIKVDALILQSDMDQVIPIETPMEIYNTIKSQEKYVTYLEGERHMIFDGSLENRSRKHEIAEYIRIFLNGGNKWRNIWKEKI